MGGCTSWRRAGTKCRRTGGDRSPSGRAVLGFGVVSPLARSRDCGCSAVVVRTSRRSWMPRPQRCWLPRRSAASATTSTKSCSVVLPRCRGVFEISPVHRPIGYAQYATFQPTFLYELIWNLLLAGLLVWLGRRRRIRAPGLFALYIAGYSFARIGEELLRVDPAHHIFGLRLNFYVASILCIAGVAWFVRIQRVRVSPTAVRRGSALLAAGGLLALTGCGQVSHTSATRPAPPSRAAVSTSSRLLADSKASSKVASSRPPRLSGAARTGVGGRNAADVPCRVRWPACHTSGHICFARRSRDKSARLTVWIDDPC